MDILQNMLMTFNDDPDLLNCGITGLRKAEKVSIIMLILVAQARHQTMKTLKQWTKWFWIIAESLLERSFGACQAIFRDVLGIKSTAAKIIPKLLNFEKKQSRVDLAQEMLTTLNDDSDLLKKAVTADESWVYGYDIKTKAQSFRYATIEQIKEKLKQDLLAIT